MADAKNVDVAFVCLPHAEVMRPSIGLGQLQASLTSAGIESKSLFPNLMFLDYVGIEDHGLFELARVEDCLGDWIFSQIAFPDFEADDTRYIDRLLQRNPKLADALGEDAHARLHKLRALMPSFIDWVANTILETNPRIVGSTSTFQQHVASLALLRRIRERAPDMITMMGGANCETVMGRATHRQFEWVDFVVSGEADGLIVPLCENIMKDGRKLSPEQIPFGVLGPVHREIGYPSTPNGDGTPRATTGDINAVPLPLYDDYFEALSNTINRNRILPGLSIETARGCWWGERQHCLFCGLNGGSMEFRAKSADAVIADMETLKARHGFARFEAVDNIMASSFLDTLVPAIKGRGYNIFYETKANLKPEEVKALSESGIRWIQPGIENLDTRMLKLMRKGVTAWNNVRLLRSCRQYGVRAFWSILCGFPGEDDDWFTEMAEILPALAHLQPGGMSMLRFDRYSPYFDQAETYNLNLRPSELYQFVYPGSEEELAEQVYFFEDRDMQDRGRSMTIREETERPGLNAVRQGMREWIDTWSEVAPTLEMNDDGQVLTIADTRPIATSSEHNIDGLVRQVLLESYDAPPRQRLVNSLVKSGATESDCEVALADLLQKHLVLEIDGRVIALPVQTPVTSLPSHNDFPGGILDCRAPRAASIKPIAA
jgi:ribosomal peptide maturation radical SAM protein 1